jgi:RNA polymerase subunit RPABC4/transcription elongation factor Spt4
MYCPSCGRFFPGEGATCELCGAAIPGVPSRAAVPRFDSVSLTFSVQPNCRFCAAQIDGGADTCPACGQSQSAAVEFVGFWRRFAAYLLDQFVIFAIYFGLALFSMVAVLVVASATKNDRLRQAIESGNWVSTEVKILLQVCFFLGLLRQDGEFAGPGHAGQALAEDPRGGHGRRPVELRPGFQTLFRQNSIRPDVGRGLHHDRFFGPQAGTA